MFKHPAFLLSLFVLGMVPAQAAQIACYDRDTREYAFTVKHEAGKTPTLTGFAKSPLHGTVSIDPETQAYVYRFNWEYRKGAGNQWCPQQGTDWQEFLRFFHTGAAGDARNQPTLYFHPGQAAADLKIRRQTREREVYLGIEIPGAWLDVEPYSRELVCGVY